MSFVVDGIKDIDDLYNVNIINTFNINKNVNVYEYIFVNNFKNMYTSNFNLDLEICNVKIDYKDILITKLNNNSTYIYCISFVYILNINLSINSKFEQIKIKDLYSTSFIYKDIDKNNLNLFPINLDIKNLDNRLGIGINFIICDSEKEDIYENKSMSFINEYSEEFLNNNYSYIDTSEEFI